MKNIQLYKSLRKNNSVEKYTNDVNRKFSEENRIAS